MIVAVTGGTGFIGGKLVARLVERGDAVRLLTRTPDPGVHSSIEVHQCDLLTAEESELSSILEGVEVLYHCAGQINDLSAMRALHIDATHKLVGAASHRIGRWVQLSSVGVYGPVNEGAVSEDSVLNPVGEYEVTKTESDRIVIEAADKGGFEISILRPSNVFGAGMTNQSLFNMISIIDRGLFFFIGKPGASANYIHVDNVAEALLQSGTNPLAAGKIFNLSDYRTLESFVGNIASELGKPPPRLRLPEALARLAGKTLGRVPGFPLTQSRVNALVNRSTYPISRIQHELGYRHIVSMEEGIRDLVGEYKLKFRRKG